MACTKSGAGTWFWGQGGASRNEEHKDCLGGGGIEDVDLHRCCSGAERTYDCGFAPLDIPRGDTYGQEGKGSVGSAWRPPGPDARSES